MLGTISIGKNKLSILYIIVTNTLLSKTIEDMTPRNKSSLRGALNPFPTRVPSPLVKRSLSRLPLVTDLKQDQERTNDTSKEKNTFVENYNGRFFLLYSRVKKLLTSFLPSSLHKKLSIAQHKSIL